MRTTNELHLPFPSSFNSVTCSIEETDYRSAKNAPPPLSLIPIRENQSRRRRMRTSPFGRVCSRPQDPGVGLCHQGAILLRLRPRLLPVTVRLECCPALFPISQAGVAEHIHQPIAGAKDFGPVADICHPVLLKETEGMGGEPGVEVGQSPRHRLINAPLLDVHLEPGYRRVGGQLQHGVVSSGDNGSFLLSLLRYLLLPGRVRSKRCQLLLPLLKVRVNPHVVDLPADADLFGPKSQDSKPVLLE